MPCIHEFMVATEGLATPAKRKPTLLKVEH